ncbi:DUF4396 domain-containing protein [Branchiibius cervicis]|uniref:DUF4396 domain-containing protein n=1 Tax=Branchiibius cervicis TaxID=908252 RepID=A0ABW2AQ02_9MICO
MESLSTADFPAWLTVLSWVSLLLAIGIALWVVLDLRARPQPMKVMNFVWPLTMLFGSVIWLWLYLRWGRAEPASSDAERPEKPFPASVAVGASHCGAGCSAGDIVAEFSVALIPGLAAALGLGTLYQTEVFAGWILGFVLAYLFGVVFQYFSIAPMQGLSFWPGIRAAIKADTLSILSWQIGMYGVMAIAQFVIFSRLYGAPASPLTPEFWFAMQIAMLGGFATAYPMNWFLIKAGVKEAM